MEVVIEYGIYQVWAKEWDYHEVRDGNSQKVLKKFKGEMSESNAERYAGDLYHADRIAGRAVGYNAWA